MNRRRLETIRAYWSGRVAAYSAVNADELGTIQAKVWDELIAEQLPWKHPLRILDAGCGPGFFSILMARRGHEITGVDYRTSKNIPRKQAPTFPRWMPKT